MKDLTFSVSIDEANLILSGLGRLPFAKVYALVAKIQQQSRAQANGDRKPEAAAPRQSGQEERDDR